MKDKANLEGLMSFQKWY